MKYLKGLAVVAIALVLVLVARKFLGQVGGRGPAARGGQISVIVDQVGMRQFATRIEAIGTAYANESVTITAPVAERVSKVLFESGETVKKGDLLVQLDDAEERAQVEEAKVSLDEQRRELKRVEALREKQMVSEQELDTRRSAAQAAEARLAAAQAQLQDREVRAPFAGLLGLRRISPGAFVNSGTAITTLDDLEMIKADFAVPETLLADIAIGQTIEAHSAAWLGQTFTGIVASIDSRVDPTTRAITIQAHIPNSDLKLRGGMLLTVNLISHVRDAVGIPEKALLAYAAKHYAFVLKPDGTVEKRELQLGERDIGWVEIPEGLKEGETIVVEGLMDLKDGAAVRVADAPAETAVQSQAVGP
ncbi:MAG TPA: efflux RND transporter periplasmic adaptor subunit [Kiritimatiellia bacterium]|nr:efflux RND transporter periplasmic adaptor subunit [Kiritimatiellia bacterium]